jgi:hypothetical protein
MSRSVSEAGVRGRRRLECGVHPAPRATQETH